MLGCWAKVTGSYQVRSQNVQSRFQGSQKKVHGLLFFIISQIAAIAHPKEYMLDYLGFPHQQEDVKRFVSAVDKLETDGKISPEEFLKVVGSLGSRWVGSGLETG